MKARHIEFGGGLGDVLTRIYNSSSYSELEDLSPNEEATVVLMSHNPHAKELFSWHPKASQLEIRDVGFWWPNEDLAMRAVHGLPPAPPVHLARQESVRFHPSPADQLILQELGPAPYIVLNAGAGSPDRNVPNSICNDALSAISEKWLKNHSMRAIAVGRTYTRERRVEPRFPAREGFVDLIDQLSVPGTIELIRGSAGVFCCHSALCLVAWYLNKPVFLTYPKHVGSREIDPPSHQYNLGKDRPSTIHLEFKRYTRGEFERFLDVVEKAMRS